MRFGHGRKKSDPPDPVFDNDQDLSEIWPQAVRQYEDITKQKLDTNTTFKSFKLQIDDDIKKSTTKSHQHARTVLSNIGTCLEKFGAIVAQGASVVFPPAPQCWNAISLVIQAVRGFSDIMDGFVSLMERSSAFLGRLVFFLEQGVDKDGSYLPHALRQPAYEIISQFLSVLRCSYKLATSTRERVKCMTGIFFFNSNNEVAESLTRMEDNIRVFTRTEVDEILVGVRGLAKYLDRSVEEIKLHEAEINEYIKDQCKIGDQVLSVAQQMKTTLDGRSSKEQQKENLKQIANSLVLKKAGVWETWIKQHNEVCKDHVEGTGEWLTQKESAFTRWADLDQHDGKVLFLKAESGFGKTHLFNHVVTHLEKKCQAPRGPNQTSLAYYYYGDDKDGSFERCVGSIIYQFASTDAAYAQAVVDECGRATSIARAQDRWNKLISGLQHAMRGTYFICMDGFDARGQLDTVEAMISTISSSPTKSNGVSLRFFISGNDEALSDILERVKGIHTIVLGEFRDSDQSMERAGKPPDNKMPSESLPNASDLEAVTRARIEDVCKTNPGLKTILGEENIQILLEGIRGNYKNLQAKMTEISACDTKGKVNAVINNTGADMDADRKNRIKTLDTLLSSHQARVLNTILVWVAGMSYQPSDEFLESVLFFTFSDEFLLAKQIATTYSPVLAIDKESRVGFKDGVKDILSASDNPGSNSALQLRFKGISGAEVNLCRRFIKRTCDPTDYERFCFDDFFNAMEQKVHIQLDDEDTVNANIITTCINALSCKEEDEKLKALRHYAAIWFYSHLKTLVEALDKFEPSRHFMADIGAKLVDLLYDPEMIDTWFRKETLSMMKYDWLYQENYYIDPLVSFLKNSLVAKGYARDVEKDSWVKVVLYDKSKYSVLERVAARLATHWFSCSTGMTDRDYLIISCGIATKISNPDKPFEEWNPPSPEETNKFISWAKEHMNTEIDSSTWNLCVGATHLVFEHYQEAIDALEKAEQHSHENWGLSYNLAIAHESQKNYRRALKHIQDFKSLSDVFLETNDEYREAYWRSLLNEGDCRQQCHDYELAVESYQDLLERDFDGKPDLNFLHTEALSGLFATWTKTKSYQLIIDFVRNWKNAPARYLGSTYWLRQAAREESLHTSIIVAAKHARAVEEIIALYQEAIDYKSPDPSKEDEQRIDNSAEATERLQYFQAVLRFHGSRSQQDHLQSIKCWEGIIERSDKNPAIFSTAWNASCRLASTLLEKAIDEFLTVSPSASDNYISRLENLANLNTEVVCTLRQGSFDPRLSLTRLYCLKKDLTSATKHAQARLCSVFNEWPKATDDDSLRLRFSNLAQTLTVLDNDVDAVAAWQAIPPYQLPSKSAADADVPGTGELTQSPSEVSPTNDSPATSDDTPKDDSNAPASSTTTFEAYISGYICDGNCGTEWKDMLADCWVCKHCLCVQFCARCYKKLLADDLHDLICNKDHNMLFLPPFDWEAWRTTPEDMMTVGKQLVPRLEWVDKIRKEYNVQQEQIDFIKMEKARELKAGKLFTTRWRWRSTVKKISAKKALTTPTLRRAKTVG